MQSTASGENPIRRRGRVGCPRCGRVLDMTRMRAHLREMHELGAAEVDTLLLQARREARRGMRPLRT